MAASATGGQSTAVAAELKRRSLLGLNGLNFFVADMLTGFGPFVTVYLSANHWQPTEIGFALSVGTMAAIAGQVPAGMLVDAVPYRRLITAVGIVAVIASAIVLGTFPRHLPVWGAELLQGCSASLLTPAIAAMTLTLSKRGKFAERLGGNVRFKALGSMLAALFMGYIGTSCRARGGVLRRRRVWWLCARLFTADQRSRHRQCAAPHRPSHGMASSCSERADAAPP